MTAFSDTFAGITAGVIEKLRLDTTLDTDKTKRWINLAYQAAVQDTGCLQAKADATLTAGVSSYDLPAEVAWIKLLVATYPDGSVSEPFRQVTLEELLETRRATLAGGQLVLRPIYALAGQNQLEIWPDPSAGTTLTFWYVYLPDELVADDDVPVIKVPYGSRLLEYGALVQGAEFKQDLLMMGQWQALYSYWASEFQTWLNRREGEAALQFRVRELGPRRTVLANPSADVLGR